MSLPPLPNPVIPASELVESSSGVFAALYLKEQMQAYGQACREAALKEAEQVCSHKAETKRLFLNESHYLECAEAIRSLK